MRGPHRDFVHDLLLSSDAATRGWWNKSTIESLLANTSGPHWFDIIWKVASIEAWATVFLDRPAAAAGSLRRPQILEPARS
jgi:hypothetical protein